jgi:hypothetical protein
LGNDVGGIESGLLDDHAGIQPAKKTGMNRRGFLQSAVSAAVASGAAVQGAAPTGAEGADHLEVRMYSPRAGGMEVLEGYLRDAFIPACTRAGVGPVGVMKEKLAEGSETVWVLIVHRAIFGMSLVTPQALAKDSVHQEAARPYADVSPEAAPYERYEVSLLQGIDAMPKFSVMILPGSPRIFNLRVYESHNERAHLKKVEMFQIGELEIFKRVGLNPCFFGHAVAGGRMPNLTYLLQFADEDARAKAWGKFREDPEWKRLKAKDGFADRDIVSKITNRVFVPTTYSQM